MSLRPRGELCVRAIKNWPRALLPELHQIIRFYRTTDFGGNAARRNDLLEAFETPPKLQPFAAFLEETRWADAERTYKDLAAPE